MSSVNKVILIGRVGRDVESKSINASTMVANINLATTESWTKNGQKQERTEWHRLTCFGKLAEIASQYVQKGSLIYVEGSLHTSSYEDADGVKRYSTSINVRELKFLSKRSESSGSGSADDFFNFGDIPHNDDEIPF